MYGRLALRRAGFGEAMGLPKKGTPDPEPADQEADERVRVAAYSCRMFEDLGFGSVGAMLLVAAGADWHEAKRLIEKGCPLDMAMEILL